MILKLNYRDRSIKSYAMRKLTPFECFRLMGVRDDVIHTMQSTNAQAEKRIAGFKPKGKKDEMAVSAAQQHSSTDKQETALSLMCLPISTSSCGTLNTANQADR
jgi:hypothetical protein